MQVHIGTSGWVYPHWRGRFYPEGLPEPEWLGFYADHLASVEINRSFYRLPTQETFAAWREATPDGFVFSVKASRFITHMKKLKEPELTLPPLLQAMAGLGGKQGPLLFQLPPNWRLNPGRLRAFLQALPRDIRVAFELRDPSWHSEAVYDLLAEFNAAFCIYELAGFQSPRVITADFAYVRLHGPGAAYCGRYGAKALQAWADWLERQKLTAAHVYFDNDEAAYAVRDALALAELLA
ncbi:MAG: DUF72 domain-containing protein [Hydrogenophilaceae bacterium]|nr:DUF72 domain-containing protein [Hydrogenophilaceae bacterium]